MNYTSSSQEAGGKKVLHIVTVSFVINHFFGKQFIYLGEMTNNNYLLGCTPSDEFFHLAEKLDFEPFAVNVTRSISPIADILSIIKIYKFIKRNKIDVVVGHTPKGGLVSMIAAKFAGVKQRIYFRHGIVYETATGLKRKILINVERLSGLIAKKVVCVSYGVKRVSERDKLNSLKKNTILGLGTCNGVDVLGKFNLNNYSVQSRQSLRDSLNIKPEDIVVGYVGRIVKDKGIDDLINAWKILLEKHNNIKLLLVGPMEETDAISANSKDFILNSKSVVFTDFVLNSGPYFSIMDIFVLPTYREGFPTVSLEASSFEIPVLITRATGCEEAIIDKKTGRFIEHNIDSIVSNISYYILNQDIRIKHGYEGRKFVLDNFEQTKVWDEIHSKLEY